MLLVNVHMSSISRDMATEPPMLISASMIRPRAWGVHHNNTPGTNEVSSCAMQGKRSASRVVPLLSNTYRRRTALEQQHKLQQLVGGTAQQISAPQVSQCVSSHIGKR